MHCICFIFVLSFICSIFICFQRKRERVRKSNSFGYQCILFGKPPFFFLKNSCPSAFVNEHLIPYFPRVSSLNHHYNCNFVSWNCDKCAWETLDTHKRPWYALVRKILSEGRRVNPVREERTAIELWFKCKKEIIDQMVGYAKFAHLLHLPC